MAAVARLRSVVVDCPEPRELARFYAAVGGGMPEEEDPDWVVLQIPAGPRLAFQRAPGYSPPDWPRADHGSQQFHLDFDAGGTWEEVDEAEQKVLALGARPLDREDDEKKDFRVYADPAGHPFCLCRIEQP
ncbi:MULTISPECIES: VOC family protein [Streptomyces]|uniref:VOC family protein n=1 Tax=Streptomyces prasinus TaxID=67345 RepID=A0ABX6AVE3_9ACTN|nr:MULTISPECIES: VOC family protein [Streptomyces]MCP3768949.1 VOC family protein [Streptomyces sp. MAR25Y5]OBQ48544.1 glyoxalase [Streptomyces sp. H-KF8]QEV06731.1 VOC family protein [Streptomyces prasinus]